MLLGLLLIATGLVAVGHGPPARAHGHGAGDLDDTFDDDGIAITEVIGRVVVADVAVQVVPGVGERVLVLTTANTVWRLRPDGSLDTAFDDDGVLVLGPEVDGARIRHLATAPNGRFVVAGEVEPTPALGEARVVRYLPGGALDTAFDDDGVAVVTGFPEGGDPACSRTISEVADVAVRGDDGTVVLVIEIEAPAGEFCAGSQDASLLVLLTATGAVDEVTETTNVGGWRPREAAVAADGGIAVSAAAGGASVGVARYLPSGQPDAAFGVGGVQTFAHANLGDLPLVVTDDDRAVLGASAGDGVTWDLIQWEAGVAPAQVGQTALPAGTTSDQLRDLRTLASGDVVLVGRVEVPGSLDAMLVGTHDSSGTSTSVEVVADTGGSGGDLRMGLGVRLADGSLRLVGTTRPDLVDITSQELVQARLAPDGAVDVGWAPDGSTFVRHLGRMSQRGLAVDVRDDLGIVVGGDIPDNGREDRAGFVLRHDQVGARPTSFSTDPADGVTVVRPGIGEADRHVVVEGVALDGDDRPTVVGTSGDGGVVGPGLVARLSGDVGSPDPAFNIGEVVEVETGTRAVLRDVAVDDQGRIVAVGDTDTGIDEDPVAEEVLVVRLLADGTPDAAFGSGGLVRLFPSDAGGQDWRMTGRGVALDGQGRVVVTGASQAEVDDQAPHLLVARLLPDGTRDPDFATHALLGDGVRIGPSGHVGNDVAVLPSGAGADALVVAATRTTVVDLGLAFRLAHDGVLVGVAQDGTPDERWGPGGVVLPFAGVDEPYSIARGVAVDPVGNVVVVGASEVGEGLSAFTTVDQLVARLHPDVGLDPGFGADGVVATDLGPASAEQAEAVAIAPDGKIVVAGHVTDDRSTRILVARYLPGTARLDCVPDPADAGDVTVGATGQVTVTCTAVDDRVRLDAVSVDPASPDAGDFSLDAGACIGITLEAGDDCTVEVTFAPSALGPASATMQVAAVAATGALPVDVGLVGTGVRLVGPGFAAVPDPVVFAPQLVTTTSALPAGRVIVTNVGSAPLQVDTITVVGVDADDFAVTATTCLDLDVAPDATCRVDVAFTPGLRTDAVRTARLRFTDNATGAPHTVDLRGQVTAPTLVLDPVEGPIGTEVEATGAGFASGVPVRLQQVGTTVVFVPPTGEVEGGFAITFEVPPETPGGPGDVVACQRCETPDEFAADAEFTVTPRLFVSPAIGPPGMVPELIGDGFVPDVPVALGWDRGIGGLEVTPDDVGEFRTSMLVFHKDLLGTRVAGAVPEGAAEGGDQPVAEADFLVVPGSSQPGDFLVRR